MTALTKYNLDTNWTTLLSSASDLDSKTTTTAIAASPAITNSSNMVMWIEISLILGAFNPGGAPYFEVNLLPLVHDGSTYADRTGQTVVGTITQDTSGSNTKEGMTATIPIPPGDFKVQLVNITGSTTAASGNSAKYRLTNYNLNG